MPQCKSFLSLLTSMLLSPLQFSPLQIITHLLDHSHQRLRVNIIGSPVIYHYKGPEPTWFFLGLPTTVGFLRGTSLHGSQACFNRTWLTALEVSSMHRCSPPSTVAGADVRYKGHPCLSWPFSLTVPLESAGYLDEFMSEFSHSQTNTSLACFTGKNYTILLPLKTPKNTFFFFLYTKSPKIWDLCAYVLSPEVKSLLHLPPKHLLFSLL